MIPGVFSKTCPNENCGWQVNYSSDKVAGLTNVEHESKILAEAAALTTLEQKFDRLVSLEMTDGSTSHLYNTMHSVTLSNVQRSDRKQRSQKANTSLTICQSLQRMWKEATHRWIDGS